MVHNPFHHKDLRDVCQLSNGRNGLRLHLDAYHMTVSFREFVKDTLIANDA